MIVFCIHSALLVFGFLTSLCLIVAITRGTPSVVKNYSVLLFWSAFNDCIAVAANIVSMERMTMIFPSMIIIPSGPCTMISLDFCNYCNSVFCGTVIQSIVLQCISFWYRSQILSKPPPNTVFLHIIIILASLPNICHMVAFKQKKLFYPTLLDPLREKYPSENWTGAQFYGLSDLFEPTQAMTYAFFFVEIPILFAFLVIMRNRVLHGLKEKRSMSDKTYALHKVFLKVLTIHAILPVSIVFGVIANVPILLGLCNPEFEALVFLIAIIPSIVSPTVTIWFIKPYRKYLANLFCCNGISQIGIRKTSSTHVHTINVEPEQNTIKLRDINVQ